MIKDLVALAMILGLKIKEPYQLCMTLCIQRVRGTGCATPYPLSRIRAPPVDPVPEDKRIALLPRRGVAQRTQFLWDAGGGDNHLLRETKFAEAVRDCRAYFTSTTFKEKRWLDVVDQWMYFRKSQMMYFSTANSRGSSIVLLKDSVSVKI